MHAAVKPVAGAGWLASGQVLLPRYGRVADTCK